MEEITKHINDTNASYRHVRAGDAKNTDLFLDNEHYDLFRDCGEQITVRFEKTNLTQAILFIASILPRKFDQSANHYIVNYSNDFVADQLAILDALFKENGDSVNTITQIWNARKDVLKKNGEVDNRFYFNNLLKEVEFKNHNGDIQTTKFTIRNYLAGGFSNLSIKKAADGIFDVRIDNVTEPYNDSKEDGLEDVTISLEELHDNCNRQIIFYGAPGTGKSHAVENDYIKGNKSFRITFHPDTDYASFVGCYKPTMERPDKNAFQIFGYNELVVKFKEYLDTEYEDRKAHKFAKNVTTACSKFGHDYYDSIVRMEDEGIHTISDLISDAYKDGTTYDSVLRAGMRIHQDACKVALSQITYSFVPQVFLKSYVYAWNNPDKKTFLVIEELNRGNCAQIFGDIFQLLDRRADEYAGYSKYAVNADTDIAKYLQQYIVNDEYETIIRTIYKPEETNFDFSLMALPKNLYILATMNTSDQSLFPIDSAFKRRWEMEYVKVNYGDAAKFKLEIDDKHLYSWEKVLKGLNGYIKSETNSTNKIIGNRFAQAKVGDTIDLKTFRDKVLFFLFNDVFKDNDDFVRTFFGADAENMFFEDLCESDDIQPIVRFLENICKATNLKEENKTSEETPTL